MRQAIVLASFLLALSLAAHARADEPTAAEPSATQTRWYGWQTLVADGLSIGTLALASSLDSTELAVLGLATFITAPLIVHMVHSNWLGAGISLTLRLGGTALLVAGFAIALSNLDFGGDEENRTSSHDDDEGTADALVALGLLTIIAAPIVDALMGIERRAERPERAWSVQPWLSPRDGGGGLVFNARL